MQHMRKLVREHNVYRWAADLIGQLSEFRVVAPKNNNAEKTEVRSSAA
jgi:predicted DNA-binding protein with PD1-like motif